MSKYTGKSDFGDWCEMHNSPQEIVEKATIYLGDAKVEVKNENDLFPYYTHLIASMAGSKEGQTIHLSSHSFIDEEEKEFLSWRVRDCILFARKAKKEKTEFNLEYVKTRGVNIDEVYKQIVEVIKKNPELIKFHFSKDWRDSSRLLGFLVDWYFSGIHLPYKNKEREMFIEDAKKRGYATFDSEGIYHPVIWNMCWKVKEFKEKN